MKGPIGWVWDQVRWRGPGHQRRVKRRLTARLGTAAKPVTDIPLPAGERESVDSRR